MSDYLNRLFRLEGRVAVVIGGGGHLCSEMARGFARAGTRDDEAGDRSGEEIDDDDDGQVAEIHRPE